MFKFRSAVVIVAISASFLLEACGVLENTERKIVGEYHFAIAPDSILQSIEDGGEEIFFPVDVDSEPVLVYTDLVQWGQSDYLQILDSLHNFVWGDSVRDWNLNNMSFSLLCNQVDQGFQIASFSFFQKQNTNTNSTVEHQVDIYPGKKLINAWEFAYNSRLSGRKYFEITKEMFTAEEALMIAESNGGLEYRTAANNACEISVILSPNSVNYRGWTILYSLETYSDTYSITVDPYTGKLIK